MGNTFPSEKRHNWRVYSPAFLLWRDPLFPSGIKGSRQIKMPASRGKNRGHVPLESVTHVMRPSLLRAGECILHSRTLKRFFRQNAETSTLQACAPQSKQTHAPDYSPRRCPNWARAYSRFNFEMKLALISAGHTASHS